MSYIQVRDALDHIRKYYRRLSDFYERVADTTDDERIELLLDYMGRHEKNLSRAVGKYERQGSEGVLNTWMQYEFDRGIEEAFQEAEMNENPSFEEVVAFSQKIDQAFRDAYRQLAQYTDAPRVQELFESLAELEQGKEEHYAWSELEFGPRSEQ